MPRVTPKFELVGSLRPKGYAFSGEFALGVNWALAPTRKNPAGEPEVASAGTFRIEALTREQGRLLPEPGAALGKYQASFGAGVEAAATWKGSLAGDDRDQRLELRLKGELLCDRHFASGNNPSYYGTQWALDGSLSVGLTEGLRADISGHTREVRAHESDRWTESYAGVGIEGRLAIFDMRAEALAGRSETTQAPVDVVALRLTAKLPISSNLMAGLEFSTPLINSARNPPLSTYSALVESGPNNAVWLKYRPDAPRPYIAPTLP